MRGGWPVVLVVAAFAASPSIAAAADTTLTFDDLAPATVVTTQYHDAGGPGRGADFGALPPDGNPVGATPTVTALGPGLAHSGAAVAAYAACPPPRAAIPRAGQCGADGFIAFPLSKQHVTVVAGFVSPALSVTFTLTGYDSAGIAVNSFTAASGGAAGVTTTLTITDTTADISYVDVKASNNADFALDDVSFDNPAAPPPPDFSFVEQPKLNAEGLNFTDVVQGTELDIPVVVSRANGSNGPVTFSPITAVPLGVSAVVDPPAVGGTTAATTTLKITAAANATPGTYFLPVTAVPQTAGVGPGPRSRVITYRVIERAIYDAQIIGLEVNQDIQSQVGVQLPPNPPNAPVPYSGVLLVQQKDTVVRVWADNAAPLPNGGVGATMLLSGSSNGKPLPGSPLTPVAAPKVLTTAGPPNVTPAMRGDPRSAWEFVVPWSWLTPSTTLTAQLTDLPNLSTEHQCQGCTTNDALTVTGVPFTHVKTLNLHPMELFENFSHPAPEQQAMAGTKALSPLPIDDGSGYDVVFDATNISNIAKRNDRSDAAANLVGDWESDHPNNFGRNFPVGIAAFDVGVTIGNDRAAVDGTTIGGGALSRPLTSIAHEVGHIMHRQHASPCGGGGANGQSADDWSPDEQGWIGGVGLDVAGPKLKDGFFRVVVPPAPSYASLKIIPKAGATDQQWFDFMSYCAIAGLNDPNSWISDRGWNEIVNRYAGSGNIERSALPRNATSADPTAFPRAVTRGAAPAGSMHVSGFVDSDGVASILTVKPSRTNEQGTADSPLKLTSSAGSVPAVVMTGHVDGVGMTTEFEGDVPARGASSIAVMQPDGTVVTQITRSAHAPVVKLLAPKRAARVGGRTRTVRIRWTATDADHDALKAYVEYSRDGGRTWATIFIGPSKGTAKLPATLLGRSSNARVRVRVNDGFNETAVVSKRFVSRGAPPTVEIDAPARGAAVPAGAPLNLAGGATDDARRALTGRSLLWVQWHAEPRLRAAADDDGARAGDPHRDAAGARPLRPHGPHQREGQGRLRPPGDPAVHRAGQREVQRASRARRDGGRPGRHGDDLRAPVHCRPAGQDADRPREARSHAADARGTRRGRRRHGDRDAHRRPNVIS